MIANGFDLTQSDVAFKNSVCYNTTELPLEKNSASATLGEGGLVPNCLDNRGSTVLYCTCTLKQYSTCTCTPDGQRLMNIGGGGGEGEGRGGYFKGLF